MNTVARVSSGNVIYERFSADTGVCYIKMDNYKETRLIEGLTSKYLKNPEVQARLKKVGEEIATGYLLKRRPSTTTGPAPPPNFDCT